MPCRKRNSNIFTTPRQLAKRKNEQQRIRRARISSEQSALNAAAQREQRAMEPIEVTEQRLSQQSSIHEHEQQDARELRLTRMRTLANRRRSVETAAERSVQLERIAREKLMASASLGPMNKICPYCKAYKFADETANFCCMNGKVDLPVQQLSGELISLYTENSPIAVNFRKNLRKYNSLFQFTSFGGKDVFAREWSPSIIIHGQIHHYIGSLVPDIAEQSKYLQIYFLDRDESINQRSRILNDKHIQIEIIQIIEDVLRRDNRYVSILKMAWERMRGLPNMSIVINPDRCPLGQHQRRYNEQSADEVGVIIQPSNERKPSSRHIVLAEKSGNLQIISETHRSYDCFQYVLFFPYGEDGWDFNMKTTANGKLSIMRYYAYHICSREGQFNVRLHGKRLFQQFLVDMAAKIEGDRLNYIRLNQSAIRSTTYKGLTDAFNDNDDLENIGKRTLLASSFVGGPRYMMERCQDTMMYVRHFGNPSLFITLTCNPKWKDIVDNTYPGQDPSDRADIIARVFDLKKTKFLKLVTGPNGYFGRCIAFVSVVEYQKRGLPHLHCLLWIDESQKPRPQTFDDIVCAEIPDKLVYACKRLTNVK